MDRPVLDIHIPEEWREKIRAGATHVLAEGFEREDKSANASIVFAGTEAECDDAVVERTVIVVRGATPKSWIWEADDFRALLEEDGA